ncbi:MAG TPA: hypothetical protein VJP86_09700 [Vicinamibacterales bacterium]|nr:hypothetical protein [Vicinamibacterales bacterium]
MADDNPKIIQVPRTPRRAFDAKRPASELLLNQVAHLEWAARPASRRKPNQLRMKTAMSEGQAAERIAYLTSLVQHQQLLPAAGHAGEIPATKSSKKRAPKSPKKRATKSSRKHAPRRKKKRSGRKSRRPSR